MLAAHRAISQGQVASDLQEQSPIFRFGVPQGAASVAPSTQWNAKTTP